VTRRAVRRVCYPRYSTPVPESGVKPPSHTLDFGSPRRAAWGGVREAFGAPALVLGASFIGFGSLVRETGLPLAAGLLSTLTTWALPGQVALVELYALGASIPAIFMAVALTNARMMPMAITLMPLMRVPGRPRWIAYPVSHLVAVTCWAVGMLRCPAMPPPQRMPFFVGFASTIFLAALVGTALGFFLSGLLPREVSLGLVFVNPVYFMLLFLADLRHRGRVLALGFGTVLAPTLHALTPSWGLLLAGILGGTTAFAVDRWIRTRRG
jgi:predicted branched-subunit amino acid permease